MALRSSVRCYDTEIGRNRAVGSLRRVGWVVSGKGTKVIDGVTVYTLTCNKPWPSVGRLLQALVAAKTAFIAVMNGTARREAA